MARKKADGRLPWFPMYAADTLSDERFQGWTCEERGAWFTLILMCWREGSIPAQPEQLRRLIHLDGPNFSMVWQAIGDRFALSDEKPDRLVSPRMEVEREGARRKSKIRGVAGAKGGKAKARRGVESGSKGEANDKQLPTPRQAFASHTTPPNITPPNPIEEETTQPVNDDVGRLVGQDWMLPFRSELGERSGLGRPLGIGNNARVVTVFEKHMSAVGQATLLADCLAIAQRSNRGTPATLSFFVDWLENLPTGGAHA